MQELNTVCSTFVSFVEIIEILERASCLGSECHTGPNKRHDGDGLHREKVTACPLVEEKRRQARLQTPVEGPRSMRGGWQRVLATKV